MRVSKNTGHKHSIPQKHRIFSLGCGSLLLIIISSVLLGGFLGFSKIPGYLKANFVLLSHTEFTRSILTKNNLNDIQLDIKLKHLHKIEQKRQEALKIDQLISSDADFVPGKISANGKTFNCKLRLKGDLSDHWDNEKCSYRIRIKDDSNLLGMSSFSLQRPVTRGNTTQFLFLESLRRENVLAVRYNFINLKINGKAMGVYAMEEHFSKDLVESQKRREGVIVSFDEYRFWKNLPPAQQNVHIASTYQSADIHVRNNKRTEEVPMLLKQKVTALNLIRNFQEKKIAGEEVFSPNKLGCYLALCRLWSAEHALVFTNINFYFDPITARLEPIGYDGMPLSSIKSPYCYFSDSDHIPDNWVNHALRSPAIAKSYISHLDLFTRPSYIQKLMEDLKEEESFLRKVIFKNLIGQTSAEIWKSDGTLLTFNPWVNLKARAKGIRKELEEEFPAMSYARPSIENPSDLEVVVRNALTQPIEIIGFERNGLNWHAKENLLKPSTAILDPSKKNIIIPPQKFGIKSFEGDYLFLIPDFLDNNKMQVRQDFNSALTLKTRILGMDQKLCKLSVPIDPSRFKPERLPFTKKGSEVLHKHSFLKEHNNSYYITPGDYEVKQDIIIPTHSLLRITKGTTLRFHEEATLICKSPLIAIGSKDEPIVFTASGSKWPGLLIAQANGNSKLEHVRIAKVAGIGHDANPNGIDRGGWMLTGGVTFFQSPVDISYCQITETYSEDALNIVSSNFSMNHCFISGAFSDAFDGDFVTGQIRDCSFTEIDGDAIDLSGSQVAISNVTVSGTQDKAISAGEGSQVTVSNSRFEDIGYGIASKDSSEVRLSNIQISKANVCALAAYQKKSLFGPSKISAEKIQIQQTPKAYLIQRGSTTTINGTKIEEIDFDVKTLYQKTILEGGSKQ